MKIFILYVLIKFILRNNKIKSKYKNRSTKINKFYFSHKKKPFLDEIFFWILLKKESLNRHLMLRDSTNLCY